MTTRSEQRNGFAQLVRIRLLEVDMDEQEENAAQVLKELAGIRRTLIGLLTTIVGATLAALLAKWPA